MLQYKLQCIVVRPVEKMALHCVSPSIIKMHSSAHHPMGGLELHSLSSSQPFGGKGEWVCVPQIFQIRVTATVQLGYLTRGFLDKKEKSEESELPCSTEKVEGCFGIVAGHNRKQEVCG